MLIGVVITGGRRGERQFDRGTVRSRGDHTRGTAVTAGAPWFKRLL